MNNINRRKFIINLGTIAAALPIGASAFNFNIGVGKSFDFLLLGDIHFDHLKYHDLEYVRDTFSEGDVTQIKNYSRITRGNLPLLMKVVKQKRASMKADFYLQLGDFVEGLCGSRELAVSQTEGFITFVKKLELSRPFFVVKGNHDITGIGARETYKNVVLPWQAEQMDKALPNASSTFVHKDARFVLFDGYSPDQSLAWFRDVLKDHKQEILFFCVHQPVVPFNARSNWHLFGKKDQQKQRNELLNLLGEHNAMVLCGHLHKTSILTRKTSKGNFVQVCTGSVIESINEPIRDHLKGVSEYGPGLVNLELNFAPSSLKERKENLEKEKPFIKYFEYADFMGFSTVRISENNEVEMSIYANIDKRPWTTVNLSDLLT